MKLIDQLRQWFGITKPKEVPEEVQKEVESQPEVQANAEVDVEKERRNKAKQHFQKKGSHLTLRELNDVLYNAGFSFQVDMLTKECLSVDASFDLMYYVQLRLYFYDVYFTTLSEDTHWADAWYNDQLVLLEGEERLRVEKMMQTPCPHEALVLQFVGLRNYNPDGGIIVAGAFEYRFEL